MTLEDGNTSADELHSKAERKVGFGAKAWGRPWTSGAVRSG